MTHSRFLFLIGLFLWSCASVQAPQGGPKDDTPPRITGSNPKNGQTRFNEKSISLDFTENVVENNPKQLFFSPQVTTTTKPGNRRLRIIPDSGFKANTTYSLRLTGKIKDEREGIALTDTSILFSTGNHLDTLSLKTIHTDLGNKPATRKRLVQLIDSNETVYFGEGDAGNPISISGLHTGQYQILAFRDGNENYQYEDTDGPLFFDRIQLDSNKMKVIKTLPHQSKPVQIFKQRRGDTLSLEGTKPFSLRGNIQEKVIYQSTQGDKYRLFPVKETSRIDVLDSLGNCIEDTLDLFKIDSTRSFESADNSQKIRKKIVKKGVELRLIYDWKIAIKPMKAEFTFDSVWSPLETHCQGFVLSFQLQNAKSGKLKIRYDSLGFFNKKGFRMDSLVLTNEDLQTPGEISGKIETESNRDVVIELLNERGQRVEKTKGKSFSFMVQPGKYLLQCFEDQNGDGLYTGGNRKENRKAESLYLYNQAIELKPGWDIEKLVIKPDF